MWRVLVWVAWIAWRRLGRWTVDTNSQQNLFPQYPCSHEGPAASITCRQRTILSTNHFDFWNICPHFAISSISPHHTIPPNPTPTSSSSPPIPPPPSHPSSNFPLLPPTTHHPHPLPPRPPHYHRTNNDHPTRNNPRPKLCMDSEDWRLGQGVWGRVGCVEAVWGEGCTGKR